MKNRAAHHISFATSVDGYVYIRLHDSNNNVFAHAACGRNDALISASELLSCVEAIRPEIPEEGHA